MVKKILLCILILVFAGCATTGDPTQGGIFWSKEKAEVRKQDLQNELHQSRENAAGEKNKTTQLQSQKDAKLAELEEQKRKLEKLEKQLQGIEKQIDHTKALTQEKRQKKIKAEHKLKKMAEQIKAIKRDPTLPISQKAAKIDLLKQEIEDLLNLVSGL